MAKGRIASCARADSGRAVSSAVIIVSFQEVEAVRASPRSRSGGRRLVRLPFSWRRRGPCQPLPALQWLHWMLLPWYAQAGAAAGGRGLPCQGRGLAARLAVPPLPDDLPQEE